MESATMQFYGLYLLSVISTKLQVQYLELQVTFTAGHPKVIDCSGCHSFAWALDPILNSKSTASGNGPTAEKDETGRHSPSSLSPKLEGPTS